MRKTVILLLLAFAATAAQAQIKCWTDANGKRTCGDTPPPGAKTTTVRGTTASPAAPAPAAASKDGAAKDAKKGPLTPAEQEQAYRKRQAEAQKVAEEEEKKRQDLANKKQGCESAKEYLRTIESGQRIGKTDDKGERYYLEEAQIAQELAKTRQSVNQACG